MWLPQACSLILELPSDYVMTFGASDAFATSEYVLLEGKEIPQLNEVCIFKLFPRLQNTFSWIGNLNVTDWKPPKMHWLFSLLQQIESAKKKEPFVLFMLV